MRFYCFAAPNTIKQLQREKTDFVSILERIAADTDTRELVVVLYLFLRSDWFGGTAYVRQWLTPNKFFAARGKWRIKPQPSLPKDLPQQFKLIRLALPARVSGRYPLLEKDTYRWQHFYHGFDDHLAFLFAHELHHFRRFHLGYHPRQGEHAANSWALQRVQECGFRVKSEKPKMVRKKHRLTRQPTFLQVVNPMDFSCGHKNSVFAHWRQMIAGIMGEFDVQARRRYVAEKMQHFARLRQMPVGARLWISYDPSQRYSRQSVCLIRPLRKDSLRIIVETEDGKKWRWPMAWLSEEPLK